MGYPSELANNSTSMEALGTDQAPPHVSQTDMNTFTWPPNVQQSDNSYLAQESGASMNIFSNTFPEPQLAQGLRYSNMFYTSFDEHNPLLKLSAENVAGGKEENKGKY